MILRKSKWYNKWELEKLERDVRANDELVDIADTIKDFIDYENKGAYLMNVISDLEFIRLAESYDLDQNGRML